MQSRISCGGFGGFIELVVRQEIAQELGRRVDRLLVDRGREFDKALPGLPVHRNRNELDVPVVLFGAHDGEPYMRFAFGSKG